jgi:hypothetical protein
MLETICMNSSETMSSPIESARGTRFICAIANGTAAAAINAANGHAGARCHAQR